MLTDYAPGGPTLGAGPNFYDSQIHQLKNEEATRKEGVKIDELEGGDWKYRELSI